MLPNSALWFEGLLSGLTGNVPWFCVSALRLPALLLDSCWQRLYWNGTHHSLSPLRDSRVSLDCYVVIEFLLREQTFFMACNKISGGARISFQRCLVALSSLSLPSSFLWIIFFLTSLEGVILFYCLVNLELLFRKCASLVAHCALCLFSYCGYCCIIFSEILTVFIHSLNYCKKYSSQWSSSVNRNSEFLY